MKKLPEGLGHYPAVEVYTLAKANGGIDLILPLRDGEAHILSGAKSLELTKIVSDNANPGESFFDAFFRLLEAAARAAWQKRVEREEVQADAVCPFDARKTMALRRGARQRVAVQRKDGGSKGQVHSGTAPQRKAVQELPDSP